MHLACTHTFMCAWQWTHRGIRRRLEQRPVKVKVNEAESHAPCGIHSSVVVSGVRTQAEVEDVACETRSAATHDMDCTNPCVSF